jgi:hypothetical protein
MSFLFQPSRASPWLALAAVASSLVVLSSVLALFGSRNPDPQLAKAKPERAASQVVALAK